MLQMPAQLVNNELKPTFKQVNRAGTTHKAKYRFYQGVANWPVPPQVSVNACWDKKVIISHSNCVLIDEADKYLSIVTMASFKTF